MPIYEYECQKCGRSFEYMQSFSEPPRTTCEECGGTLEKKISAAGFILKGGGWYKDLYSSTKKGGSGESKDSGSKDSGSKSSESKSSESKSPEKKSKE